ncbi:MAG: dTDP-4-dehydrorhamnose reductase [Pseudoruegeria sp.]
MNILLFGRTGQVAQEIQARCPADVSLIIRDRSEADFTDPKACVAWLSKQPIDAIINAVAYTAVDTAETDERTATLINGETPTLLAQAAAELNIPFVHISTDYVFDGTGTQPWEPDAGTAPIGAYGRSKLSGEDGIRAANGPHAILRTSWVFSAHGTNFVKTMLRLAETRDALNVVCDQIGGPTAAGDIANTCLQIARALHNGNAPSGTYHLAGTPAVSWADFAHEIFAQAGKTVSVTGIKSADYPTPAKRPLNSRMDCSTLTQTFGIAAPNWKTSLADVLKTLAAEPEQ